MFQIKITIIPDDISITANSSVCLGELIELLTDCEADASYFWQGPNNFSSTIQSPVIENASTLNTGIYSLIVKFETCVSEPILKKIEVKSLLSLWVTGNCVKENADYELKVESFESNFNSSDFTYSWKSPSGYLGSANPISILGKETGDYTVTVTNNLGCAITLSHEVKDTVCKIPKGISPNNDGANDSFNLTGFDVKNLIKYARYGRIVYEKKNYLNEWFGQDFEGRSLSDATYFYHIETYSGEEFVGWIF
jgi:gliding motility-associated-like protein